MYLFITKAKITQQIKEEEAGIPRVRVCALNASHSALCLLSLT